VLTVIEHAAAHTCNFSSKKMKMKMEIRQELNSVSLFVLQTTTVLQLCFAKTKTIETHYRN